MQRDVFGVRLGVLVLVLPLFVTSMLLQAASRGVWNHPPDSRYYITMMSRDMGHNWTDSVQSYENLRTGTHLAPWYFAADDPTWQMVRTRVLYPALSIPFVWVFGLAWGCLAVPILSDVLFFWVVARMLQRLYGPAVAVIVTSGFALVNPIFGFSWAGTDTLAMALAAVIVANLPIERTIGRANLVWLGAATVFIALTRQVGVLAPAMAGAGWLWCLLKERSWRNRWLAPLAVTSAGVIVLQIATSMLVTTNAAAIVSHGQTSLYGTVRVFVHNLRIVTQEAMTYMWHSDRILLALLVAAGLGMVARLKSDAAAVFLGAVGATYVITAGVGFSSYMRYEMIMFPAAAVAGGAFVSLLLGEPIARIATLDEPAVEPDPLFSGLRFPQLARGARAGGPRRDRWIPQTVGAAVLLVVVCVISAFGEFPSTTDSPPGPSYAAAQGATDYAVRPLATPPAEVTLKAAFIQAAKVAKGDGMLEGAFDWVHSLRYRPTAPNQPEWNHRAADGTAVTRVNGMDDAGARAFGDAVTFHRTVLPDTVKIISRQTSAYGEDVVFTVQDDTGAVHRGTATTLYPIWSAKASGDVTSLVFDP